MDGNLEATREPEYILALSLASSQRIPPYTLDWLGHKGE